MSSTRFAAGIFPVHVVDDTGPRAAGLQSQRRSIMRVNLIPLRFPAVQIGPARLPGGSSTWGDVLRHRLPARSFRSRRLRQYTAQLLLDARATHMKALAALLD